VQTGIFPGDIYPERISKKVLFTSGNDQ